MPFKVEVISSSPKSVLGEGPHWDEQSQSLLYNDIYGTDASVLRYDYNENKVYSAKIDGEPIVGFIIPVANTTKTCDFDEYAVGLSRRVGIIHWVKLQTIICFILRVFIILNIRMVNQKKHCSVRSLLRLKTINPIIVLMMPKPVLSADSTVVQCV